MIYLSNKVLYCPHYVYRKSQTAKERKFAIVSLVIYRIIEHTLLQKRIEEENNTNRYEFIKSRKPSVEAHFDRHVVY